MLCEHGMVKDDNGILIDDLSDHLPIFHIIKSNKLDFRNKNENIQFKYLKQEKDVNIARMAENLLTTDWFPVLKESDTNKAYNTFQEIFAKVHRSCCPIKKIKIKDIPTDKTWLTPGLRNACRKKYNLYHIFLKKKDKDSEKRYKIYKNKLKSILRKCEKQYYKEQLYSCQTNMKQTWAIINDVLKRKKKNVCIEQIKLNGQVLSNKTLIANEFNTYFVNIGEKLCNKIEKNRY